MRPRGKGVYLRDSPARDPAASVAWCAAAGVEWAGVNVVPPATMRALRSAGVAVYVFGLPSQWAPESWRTTLARSLEVAIATGAEGILADPENGWGGPTSTEVVALAHELQLASRVMSVGVTTNDGRRPMAATIARLAPRVWFSVQTYDHQRGETYERPAALVAAWEARLGAGRVLASGGAPGRGGGAPGRGGGRGVSRGPPRRVAAGGPRRDPVVRLTAARRRARRCACMGCRSTRAGWLHRTRAARHPRAARRAPGHARRVGRMTFDARSLLYRDSRARRAGGGYCGGAAPGAPAAALLSGGA